MMKRSIRGLTALGALLVAGSGCVDLDVVNTQAPDKDRALADPASIESLVAGTFGVLFTNVHNTVSVNHLFATLADQNSTIPWWGSTVQSRQPRSIFDNSVNVAQQTGPHGPRVLWSGLNEVLSSSHDALRAVRIDGTKFMHGDVDMTARGEAFGKFMQGTAWGYLSMIYDEGIVIPEEVEFQSDVASQVREALTPYPQVREAALGALDEAISIAESNSFTFPSSADSWLWFASPTELSSQHLAQLANTMAARILVLSARTPQERAAVDWNRVLDYTSKGLTYDFGTSLSPDRRSSWLMSASQAIIEVSSDYYCCYRLDYKIVGPADTSGQYQEWIAADIGEREPFLITTPDRRITGASPQLPGAYVRYRSNHNGFTAADGLYRRSFYQWGRHAIRNGQSSLGSGYQIGTAYLATADENNLLRAEALLRLGQLDAAAELINVTRTRAHATTGGVANLPPVTAAGVPESDSCVPRTDAGACGDLLTALRYERMLELVNLDAVRGWADARGFGILPDGTFLQQPVPGNELNLLGLPNYSYGGVGTEWGAVYAPALLN